MSMNADNKYCRALAQLRSKPTHELKEVGDQWRTPDLLFWGINAMFGPLVLDLFADDSNAKCPAWYTAEDNALTQDWSERLAELGGAGFGNPPYSRSQYHDKQAVTGMTHIINHAIATSETWWPEEADHVTFIRGRIGFDLPTWFVPKDEKQHPTSAFLLALSWSSTKHGGVNVSVTSTALIWRPKAVLRCCWPILQLAERKLMRRRSWTLR